MTPASLQALDGLRDLTKGGLLIWEYPWWNRSFGGVWLIFFFGYFHFYVAALLVIGMKTVRAKVVAMGILGWHY